MALLKVMEDIVTNLVFVNVIWVVQLIVSHFGVVRMGPSEGNEGVEEGLYCCLVTIFQIPEVIFGLEIQVIEDTTLFEDRLDICECIDGESVVVGITAMRLMMPWNI